MSKRNRDYVEGVLRTVQEKLHDIRETIGDVVPRDQADRTRLLQAVEAVGLADQMISQLFEGEKPVNVGVILECADSNSEPAA